MSDKSPPTKKTTKQSATKSKSLPRGKKGIRLGDVIAIKLRSKCFVFGKVAYCSKREGVVLLLMYDHVSNLPTPPESLPTSYRTQGYSWASYIAKGRWPVVGHQSLTDDDRLRTIYVCGRAVYMGDKRLRKSTDEDFDTLPVKVIQFDLGLEQDLRTAFKL